LAAAAVELEVELEERVVVVVLAELRHSVQRLQPEDLVAMTARDTVASVDSEVSDRSSVLLAVEVKAKSEASWSPGLPDIWLAAVAEVVGYSVG